MSEQNFLQDELAADTNLIRDKFAIDLINSIQVGDDLIVHQPNNSGFFSRAFNQLTGKNLRHQNALNSTLLDGLNATKMAIEVMQQCQAESDMAIKLVTDKLLETRQGVMRIQDRVDKLECDIETLYSRIDVLHTEMNARFTLLENRLSFTESKISIDMIIEDWKSGRWDNYEFSLQIYFLLSELKMGKLGYFLTYSADPQRCASLRKYLAAKLTTALTKPQRRVYLQNELFNQVQTLPELSKHQFGYLIEQQPSTNRLLTAFSKQLNHPERPVEAALLPYSMSELRLSTCLMDEVYREVA